MGKRQKPNLYLLMEVPPDDIDYDDAVTREDIRDQLMRETNAGKVCTITNGRFNWRLDVDGHSIPFNLTSSMDYFEQHYTALGYEVRKMREQ